VQACSPHAVPDEVAGISAERAPRMPDVQTAVEIQIRKLERELV